MSSGSTASRSASSSSSYMPDRPNQVQQASFAMPTYKEDDIEKEYHNQPVFASFTMPNTADDIEQEYYNQPVSAQFKMPTNSGGVQNIAKENGSDEHNMPRAVGGIIAYDSDEDYFAL